MLVLAVVAEALAVVGEQDDERLVVDPQLLEPRDEAADDGVGGGDVAVVLVGVARGEGLGRRVRGVGLVEVEEEEELPLGDAVQPAARQAQGLAARALLAAQRGAALGFDGVFVEVEAGAEAGLAAEDEAGDGAAGRVAEFLELARQEGDFFEV